jgi:potassium-dependent mechanosensitive channel
MPFQPSFLKNRRFTSIGRLFTFTTLHLLLFFWAPSALAQPAPLPGTKAEPSSPAAPAPTAPTPKVAASLEPIPLSDIAKRLENSRRLLKETSERDESNELAEIAQEVNATRSSFTKEAEAAEAAIAGSPRPEDLWDLEVPWKNRVSRIAKWQQVVSAQSARLYKDLTLLEQEEQVWELTLKSYGAGALPREVERAIRDYLGAIKKIKAELRKRLDQALVLENELYLRDTTITRILGDVALAKERFRDSLMVAERVPLWKIGSEWEHMALPAGGVAGLIGRQVSDGLEFLGAHRAGLVLFVFFFFVVLIGASLLSRNVAQWTREHPHFEQATHFLKRPVSLALLVTLVLFLVFFSANTPRMINASAAFLLLVPILTLLPPLVHPAARSLLFILAGFYILDSFRAVLLPTPLLDRLSFVVSDLVVIGILAWLFRPSRLRQSAESSPTPVYLILASRIVLVFASISLGANVLGYFDLARVIATGTLYSAYALFVVFGAAQVLSVSLAVFLDTDLARSLAVVRRHGGAISQGGFRLLSFAAVVIWLEATLRVFAVKEEVTNAITGFLTAPIREGRVDFSLWDIIAFGLVLGAAILISRGVRLLLQEDVFPRMRLARGIPAMITTTVYYTILLFGFFFALGIAGVDINRFTLLAGAFGVGVGFGLQNIVNNFLSGLILLFERPIQPGDTIEVGGVAGVVKSIGIRSSTIATGDGADAIIPNATLISEKLMNWTLTDPWRRMAIPIGVAYGSDLAKVMHLLLSVAASDSNILKDPAPAVGFQGFGESAINFELRFWTLVQSNVDIKSRVSIAMAQTLAEAGIEIPVPQRDLRLRAMDKNIEGLISHGAVESGAIATKDEHPRK